LKNSQWNTLDEINFCVSFSVLDFNLFSHFSGVLYKGKWLSDHAGFPDWQQDFAWTTIDINTDIETVIEKVCAFLLKKWLPIFDYLDDGDKLCQIILNGKLREDTILLTCQDKIWLALLMYYYGYLNEFEKRKKEIASFSKEHKDYFQRNMKLVTSLQKSSCSAIRY